MYKGKHTLKRIAVFIGTVFCLYSILTFKSKHTTNQYKYKEMILYLPITKPMHNLSNQNINHTVEDPVRNK